MTLKKCILTFIIGILLTTIAFGQSSSSVDSLTFCSVKYKVPKNCIAESQYQIKCDDYSMIWLYMTKEMLGYMPDKFVEQLKEQTKKFNKKAISCYLLDTKAKGYEVSFKVGGQTKYQIIAYGTVNGHPVLVQLSLKTKPKSNDDIPKFPRQIVKLTK